MVVEPKNSLLENMLAAMEAGVRLEFESDEKRPGAFQMRLLRKTAIGQICHVDYWITFDAARLATIDVVNFELCRAFDKLQTAFAKGPGAENEPGRNQSPS
jgi:hypothetical protein